MSENHNHPTWDIPTRLFHWLLVVCVFLAWLSQEQDWITVHLWTGYTVLVLVTFRIIWGFVGSTHSRFANFLRSPAATFRYWRGLEQPGPGHNPAGAWSVLALLSLLLIQALSGLFNSDGLLFDGPLYYAIDSDFAARLGDLHDELYWIILGFVGLHVAAVLYYQLVRREPLIGAMFNGGRRGERAPVALWRALLVVALCAGALALAVYLAPEPELPW